MEAKRMAAEKAVEYVQDGMIIGLGTGSTAYWAIQNLGQKIKSGLNIRAVATSNKSEIMAKELGIRLIPFSEIESIDITIDGADEVDPNWNLIKGGGGALLREKMVASASNKLIIVVDDRKLVQTLGRFPLPVEVVKFGYELTMGRLGQLGCKPRLRYFENKPYSTDNGNYIVDCDFAYIKQPEQLHNMINMIPGVVDNGLFINLASNVIVGYPDGKVRELEKN